MTAYICRRFFTNYSFSTLVLASAEIRTSFGRPFVKRLNSELKNSTHYETVRRMLSDRCLSVCYVRALWPNGWTDQDETWHAGRPRPWPHCVRQGPSSPSPKRGTAPQFLANICCGQMAACIKTSLGMKLSLGSWYFVLDGEPAPLPQKGAEPPKFSAHVYCGQTAGWMKLLLGMEVGLIPSDFVLDGDPAPFPKRRRSPQFSAHVYCGQTAGWIKMALGMEVGLSPVHIVLDGDTAPLPQKGGRAPSNFRPIFIVAKRMDA